MSEGEGYAIILVDVDQDVPHVHCEFDDLDGDGRCTQVATLRVVVEKFGEPHGETKCCGAHKKAVVEGWL